MQFDLVLSSGYVAFGSQAGFLSAVEAADLRVTGVCGTSSGALCSALWLSGLSSEDVFRMTTVRAPLRAVRFSSAPWRGLFTMEPVIRELRQVLRPRFEDLDVPFAVGVLDDTGAHRLLREGPLPEAVAASCAMPYVFHPISLGALRCSDGGAIDRTGLGPWRAIRGRVPTILHLIERSHGAQEDGIPSDVLCVRSPRSGASLWSLGPARQRFEDTRAEALRLLRDPDVQS